MLKRAGALAVILLAAFAAAVSTPVTARAEPPADTAGVTWLVPPIHDHGLVRFCTLCGFFSLHHMLIDPETGALTDEIQEGHGPIFRQVYFVYDPILGMFGEPSYSGAYFIYLGMRPFDERFDICELENNLISVQAVDSAQRRYFNELSTEWHLLPEAFLGTYALMYNGEFITDFIFDGGMSAEFPRNEISVAMNGRWGIVNNRAEVIVPFIFDALYPQFDNDRIIAVYNGGHGLIDTRGNVLLPHVFEHIVMIDEYRAFAKYGGLYGIVAISHLVSHVGLMPQTGGGGFVLLYRFFILFAALVGVGLYKIMR